MEQTNENNTPLFIEKYKTIDEVKEQHYVKLNLGCGNKLFDPAEGWVNVDIKGEDIDIQADITKVHEIFGDNVADEIHLVHVLEHFVYEDVEPFLSDCLKVLKPGGKIYLEQPDVVKCALNLIQVINRPESRDLWWTEGLQGFYSDYPIKPEGYDYYDLHKWGWFPNALKEVLLNCGFVNVVEHEPLKRQRKSRDFRMCAQKV